MIPASASFTTANAALAKKPIYALCIDGYPYYFSNTRGLGGMNSVVPVLATEIREEGTSYPSYPNGGSWSVADETGGTIFLGQAHPLNPCDRKVEWSGFAAPAGATANGTIKGTLTFPKGEISFTYLIIFDGIGHSQTLLFAEGDFVFVVPAAWDLATLAVRLRINNTMNVHYTPPLEVVVAALRLEIPVSASNRPWIDSLDDLSITVNDLDGGATLGELSVTVQDRGRAITADFPSFVFEGKVARLKTGFSGMAFEDFVTLFTGSIESVNSANSNNDYVFVCTDISSALGAVIYSTGDDGQPTDSDHPRTLNAHPLDLMLHILADEIELDSSYIDRTRVERYRDEVFPGLQFQFTIDSPPSAMDFIQQQLMKPLGGYMYVNALGKITVHFFQPLPDDLTPVMTLDESMFTEIPEAQQSDLVNYVAFRFDKSDNDYLTERIAQYGPSLDKYGIYAAGEQVIESDGVRSSLQGHAIATATPRAIFLRYGLKNLRFDSSLLWNACLLEPGDLVVVNHSKVPDRVNGAFGISGWLMLVADRAYDFTNGLVKPLLVDASYMHLYGRYKITPDDIPAWTAATTAQKDRYMFLCDAAGKYSDGTDGHSLG